MIHFTLEPFNITDNAPRASFLKTCEDSLFKASLCAHMDIINSRDMSISNPKIVERDYLLRCFYANVRAIRDYAIDTNKIC